MPRYAPVMSQDDLRRMLVDKAIANDYVEEYGELDPAEPDVTQIVCMLLSEDLIADVEKDWSKIDFSTENLDVIGEKVTPQGVPYLLISTGGDWEAPLLATIYFDGKKLRGYIPKDGNSYNHQEKAAFGNNDSDQAACVKQFGDKYDKEEAFLDVDPDGAAAEKDIHARIEAKGTYSYASGPVISKAKVKAAKQAEIEKRQDLSGAITSDMVHAVIEPAAGGSYVTFQLRSSRRALTVDEGHRLEGVPSVLEKTVPSYSSEVLWYAPMGCYPMQMLALLEAAGFEKAPDNDISHTAGMRAIIIG